MPRRLLHRSLPDDQRQDASSAEAVGSNAIKVGTVLPATAIVSCEQPMLTIASQLDRVV